MKGPTCDLRNSDLPTQRSRPRERMATEKKKRCQKESKAMKSPWLLSSPLMRFISSELALVSSAEESVSTSVAEEICLFHGMRREDDDFLLLFEALNERPHLTTRERIQTRSRLTKEKEKKWKDREEKKGGKREMKCSKERKQGRTNTKKRTEQKEKENPIRLLHSFCFFPSRAFSERRERTSSRKTTSGLPIKAIPRLIKRKRKQQRKDKRET